MLGRCAFRCFNCNISIPRLSWSFWTWCLWLLRFYERFLSEGSSSQRRWNRGRWIRRRPAENGRQFWFQAMADTLGTQIGFLDTDCEAKGFIYAGELLMSLCNAASECVVKAASSTKIMSRQSTVLNLVLVRRRLTLKCLGADMEVTLPEEASKAEDRRREKTIRKSVSWLRHSPVPSRDTVPVMFPW